LKLFDAAGVDSRGEERFAESISRIKNARTLRQGVHWLDDSITCRSKGPNKRGGITFVNRGPVSRTPPLDDLALGVGCRKRTGA